MYQPPAFLADAQAATGLIADHPLAQLVVSCADGLLATPVPLLWRGDSLVGHLARPNSLWRHEGAALAIFTGAQAYVSPNWYPSKREHGKAVPTWNYETVHVHGTLVGHDDPEWKRAVLELQTEWFERPSAVPWRIADAPSEYISRRGRHRAHRSPHRGQGQTQPKPE